MIKVTLKKESPNSLIRLWIEGFEEKEIKDNDIEEVLNIIECAKKTALELMRTRQEKEYNNRASNLKLYNKDENDYGVEKLKEIALKIENMSEEEFETYYNKDKD